MVGSISYESNRMHFIEFFFYTKTLAVKQPTVYCKTGFWLYWSLERSDWLSEQFIACSQMISIHWHGCFGPEILFLISISRVNAWKKTVSLQRESLGSKTVGESLCLCLDGLVCSLVRIINFEYFIFRLHWGCPKSHCQDASHFILEKTLEYEV